MSDDRVERVLAAAYSCFVRHGVRRTTMDDIATAAEMSRAAVYQYVQNKDDAFRRLATRMFDGATDRSRAAAATDGPVGERLYGALSVKLELALQLTAESPHAEELLGASTSLSGELAEAYIRALHGLVVETLVDAEARGEVSLADVAAPDLADIALALLAGLEAAHLSQPDVVRRRLHQGVALLVAGLAPPR